jgi:hypothetical protein
LTTHVRCGLTYDLEDDDDDYQGQKDIQLVRPGSFGFIEC